MTTTATTRQPAPTRQGEPFRALLQVAVKDRMALTLLVSALMIGMGLFTGALWPPLADTFEKLPKQFNDIVASLMAGADLTTPAGWVSAEMLSIVAPGGVIVVAVISAARGIAGEEDAKTSGVLMSAPITRTTFLLAKTTAMLAHVLIVTIGIAAGLIAGDLIGNLQLSTSGIVGASLHAGLLGALFGVVAVLTAAAIGQFRPAATITAGLAGLAFVSYVFLPLVDALAGLARISPWYYFANSNPLSNGPNMVHLLTLAVATVVLAVPAVLFYRRRDLRG